MIENITVWGALVIILIDSLALIFYLNKQNAPVRTTVVQMYGILILVPLVFVLSFAGKINDNTTAAILGALVGYVFGKNSLSEEWTQTKQG
jgi:hypothetical protein